MKLITYLSDQDFNQTLPTPNRIGYKVRIAGRAILTKDKNEVALMWVGKYSIYKLPGGGIKDHEDIHEGLEREVLELRWVSISEAVGFMESYLSPEYDGQFMQKRDLAILKTVVL